MGVCVYGVVGRSTSCLLLSLASATCIRLYARGQGRRILPAYTTTPRYTTNTSLTLSDPLSFYSFSLSFFTQLLVVTTTAVLLSLRSSHIPVSSTLLPPPARARVLVHWSLLFMLHAVYVLAAFAGQFPEPHDSTRAHTVAHTLLRGSAS